MKRSHLAVALFVIMGTTSLASAQGPRARGFGRGMSAGFLTRNYAVQKELNMTNEQKTNLEEKLRAARGDFSDFAKLSQEERLKRFEEISKKSDEAIKSVLDEKQQKRLSELELQMAGPMALMDPEVAKKLKIEPEQKEKFRKVQQENRPTERFDFRNASAEERQKYFEESRERSEKIKKGFLAVLTAEQKEAFEKMQGKKFDFPEPQRRPRRNQN